MEVAAAAARDVPRLCELAAQAFADPWREQDFRDALQDTPRTLVLVARQAGHDAAGYVVCRVAADEMEILDLAVAAEQRRSGIGRALVAAAMRAAEGASVRSIYLEVRASNAAARALYTGAGFTTHSRRRGYYSNPSEDALVLKHP